MQKTLCKGGKKWSKWQKLAKTSQRRTKQIDRMTFIEDQDNKIHSKDEDIKKMVRVPWHSSEHKKSQETTSSHVINSRAH